MNKAQLVQWLREDADKHPLAPAPEWSPVTLKDTLWEINNRRKVTLPDSLPQSAEQMMPVLRQHLKDNVSLLSLVLSHHFPEQFFFYRVSRLEREIFEGLEFFAEWVPAFDLPFSSVGRKGVERYLQLNDALWSFARESWPSSRNPQGHILAFLYQGLGTLFLERDAYHRYWLISAKPEYFDILDRRREIGWSGRKEMQPGDLVFAYRTSPVKAITDIFQVKDTPGFDPWGAWNGFWARLTKVGSVDDIAFGEMKTDPVLSQWSVVRRRFQWTVAEAVPHSIYNRLLQKIREEQRQEYGLEPEPLAAVGRSGDFVSEAEFEEAVIAPLLRRWNFSFQAQAPCVFRFGSQDHRGRIDFLVSDTQGLLTLFEDKLRIANDEELDLAMRQAKSYALMLGLPSFAVAAPEGLWIYSLTRNIETLQAHFLPGELAEQDEEARSLFVRLRASARV